MSEYRVSGSCLCKKVSYEFTGHLGIFQYCNCSRCRKITGSAFSTHIMVSPDDFRWLKGEEYITRYELEEARHYASTFCSHCGSSLPWLAQTGKAVMVTAGTLDEDPVIRPTQGIYCTSRAMWYTDPAELAQYEELPPK
jgi:hypothetical protein